MFLRLSISHILQKKDLCVCKKSIQWIVGYEILPVIDSHLIVEDLLKIAYLVS